MSQIDNWIKERLEEQNPSLVVVATSVGRSLTSRKKIDGGNVIVKEKG